ncbi:MAG: GspH/FimT family pseudopilin [Betaproteobacteria bacterium]|nr:GspH/FimT family pseudopilin [Betaproteobacteria bacterium]
MVLSASRLRAGGFSLVEILVVVVVMGIALALAVPNLVPNEREALRHECERLVASLEAARDEAALGGRALSLRIKDNRLEFLERDPHSVQPVWRAATIEGVRAGPLPDGMMLVLDSGAAAVRDSITFLPVGIVQPFEMRLASAHAQGLIRGDALGNISLELSNAPS